MSFDQNNRIAHYLSAYVVDPQNGAPIPPEPSFIKAAIKLLIDEDVMSAVEIRRKALYEYNVIIPSEYFP